MKMSSMIKGAAFLAAAGMAAYLYSSSSERTKRKIKRGTGRALHSAGETLESVSKIM